jgi:hypothetical protein
MSKKKRYTSEQIHRALFPRPPKARSTTQMKDGVRRHVRRGGARPNALARLRKLRRPLPATFTFDREEVNKR